MYDELGIKVYFTSGFLPHKSPSGAYEYGTLIVITRSLESIYANTQIYITDGLHLASASVTNRGVFIRNGKNLNWARLYGSSVGSTT